MTLNTLSLQTLVFNLTSAISNVPNQIVATSKPLLANRTVLVMRWAISLHLRPEQKHEFSFNCLHILFENEIVRLFTLSSHEIYPDRSLRYRVTSQFYLQFQTKSRFSLPSSKQTFFENYTDRPYIFSAFQISSHLNFRDSVTSQL